MYGIMANEIRWAFNAITWKPTQQQLLTSLSGISQEENKRIQKFRFREDYKLCLAGRLLIRKCIEKLLGISWKDILLTRSEKGKPELELKEKLYFNISHQGNYTVLAASKQYNIGVDVMKFVYPNNTDIPSFFNIMKRQFVEKEWIYIYSFQTEWEQLKAFYRLWCLKESYVKAVGVGIGTNSAERMRFNVKTRELNSSSHCTDSILFLNDVRESWCFSEFLLDNEHVVTVATHTDSPPVCGDIELLTFDELTRNLEEILPPDIQWWHDFQTKFTKEK